MAEAAAAAKAAAVEENAKEVQKVKQVCESNMAAWLFAEPVNGVEHYYWFLESLATLTFLFLKFDDVDELRQVCVLQCCAVLSCEHISTISTLVACTIAN